MRPNDDMKGAYPEMLTNGIEQLAVDLGKSSCRCHSGTAANGLGCIALHQRLLRLLAQGEPVSVEALAGVVGQLPSEVAQAIQQNMNVEYDEAGNIIAAALSLQPTPHKVEIDGRILYTWCALDALMYLPLLEQPVQVESPGAVTGLPIRMTVTPQGVENVQPETAVVSIVKPKPDLWIREAFCNDVHFFSSPETAASWLAEHQEATIIPVDKAFILGQQLLQRCC